MPYSADYFGHKVHVDQHEKLVMYGVTHVCSRDGYSGKVVGFITMPIKNNLEISYSGSVYIIVTNLHVLLYICCQYKVQVPQVWWNQNIHLLNLQRDNSLYTSKLKILQIIMWNIAMA